MDKKPSFIRKIAIIGLLLNVAYVILIPIVFVLLRNAFLLIGVYGLVAAVCTVINVIGLYSYLTKKEEADKKFFYLIIINIVVSLLAPIPVFYLTISLVARFL